MWRYCFIKNVTEHQVSLLLWIQRPLPPHPNIQEESEVPTFKSQKIGEGGVIYTNYSQHFFCQYYHEKQHSVYICAVLQASRAPFDEI